jgi:serine/threonine-protein kinase
VLVSDGGTVVASCTGNLVTLLSWSPAQGYHVVSVDRGPAMTATIRFSDDDGEEDHTSRLTVFCRNGRPEGKAGEDDKSPEHR